MTRISRIISVIFCFFYCQRIARISRIISIISVIRWHSFIVDVHYPMTRIARNYFFYHQMNLMNLMTGAMIIWLIWLIWWLFFKPSSCSSWCLLAKETVCCWINFCPLSPKLTNSRNSLIIIDITSYIPIKSPKIHWKSLLLYIFFANFLSYPFSKLPDPNDVVSSINAYSVNNWRLVSYIDKKGSWNERKCV